VRRAKQKEIQIREHEEAPPELLKPPKMKENKREGFTRVVRPSKETSTIQALQFTPRSLREFILKDQTIGVNVVYNFSKLGLASQVRTESLASLKLDNVPQRVEIINVKENLTRSLRKGILHMVVTEEISISVRWKELMKGRVGKSISRLPVISEPVSVSCTFNRLGLCELPLFVKPCETYESILTLGGVSLLPSLRSSRVYLEYSPMNGILNFPFIGVVRVSIENEALENFVGGNLSKIPSGLLELLLGVDEARKIYGSASALLGEPIFILAQVRERRKERREFLWHILSIACRELYREVKGGYPQPVNLANMEVERVEHWLKWYGNFSDNIVILRSELFEELGEEVEKKKLLQERLKESFSQGLGFIIILTENVDEIERELRTWAKPYLPKIVTCRIADWEKILNLTSKYLSYIFGIKPEISIVDEESLDKYVAFCDRAYRDSIWDLINLLHEGKYLTIFKPDIEKESEDHIALKLLAIKELIENYRADPNNIKCTKQLNDRYCDVLATLPDGKVVSIEVETLYGQGSIMFWKLIETVSKYEETKIKPNEVWIILPNWTVALHFGILVKLERMLAKKLQEKGIKLRFYTMDCAEKGLVSLLEIASKLLESLHQGKEVKGKGG